MAFASGDHNLIVDVICDALKAYARPQRRGVVFSDGAGFLLRRNPDTVRGPDAAYIVRERIPPGPQFPSVIPIIPDLAVEIVSANDRASELRNKAEEYLAAGVRLVWVFWPEMRTVTVYTLDSEPRTLTADDTLDGGDVLPGLRRRWRSCSTPIYRIAQGLRRQMSSSLRVKTSSPVSVNRACNRSRCSRCRATEKFGTSHGIAFR